MKKIKSYIKLMRPKHYLKNILIFLPLIFSNSLFKDGLFFKTILGFLAFNFIASSVYIINDINDREKDRNHPKKKNRPIASGEVSVKEAIVQLIVLICISVGISILIGENCVYALLFLGIYLLINVGYSFGLKNIPIIDVSILVFGFILRVLYGAVVISVEVSSWLYFTVMAMAFYLSLGKRRNEIIKKNKNTRNVLKYYTKDFLDKNMYMCLAMAIVFYSLWAANPSGLGKYQSFLIYTVPIVILICMKYSMIIESDSDGDPIEVVLSDKVLLALIFIYGLIMLLFIYI